MWLPCRECLLAAWLAAAAAGRPYSSEAIVTLTDTTLVVCLDRVRPPPLPHRQS